MFLSIQRNQTPEGIALEDDAQAVTLNVLNNPDLEYYNIKVLTNNVTLTKVNLKSGARQDGPLTEIAEVVAGQDVVGSAVIPK